MSGKAKTSILYAAVFSSIIAVIMIGIFVFGDRSYTAVSLIVALLSCLPFLIRIERKKIDVRELTSLSVMIALSVVGRLIFAPIPFFKPISAIVIITGIAFGATPGFMTGCLSAVISNIFFGQGPWTPFQMLTWGLIGLASGLIFKRGKKPNMIILSIFGALSGLFFSLFMDIWTTLSLGEFSFARYLTLAVSALPVSAIYAVSNVIFLIALTGVILSKTERLRTKFGIFKD